MLAGPGKVRGGGGEAVVDIGVVRPQFVAMFHRAMAVKACRRVSLRGFCRGGGVVLITLCLAVGGLRARADWPEFRGPHGDGHVAAAGDRNIRGLPLRWSEGENVVWKTAIPYRGW